LLRLGRLDDGLFDKAENVNLKELKDYRKYQADKIGERIKEQEDQFGADRAAAILMARKNEQQANVLKLEHLRGLKAMKEFEDSEDFKISSEKNELLGNQRELLGVIKESEKVKLEIKKISDEEKLRENTKILEKQYNALNRLRQEQEDMKERLRKTYPWQGWSGWKVSNDSTWNSNWSGWKTAANEVYDAD